MIFDHTQNRAQEFFGQLFYNHAGPKPAAMVREPPADATAFVDELYDARLPHLLRRGIVDPHQPGRLCDGFAIDYGCYVSLLLVGDQTFRVRDRGNWISSPKGVPPDGFSLTLVVVDLPRLLGEPGRRMRR